MTTQEKFIDSYFTIKQTLNLIALYGCYSPCDYKKIMSRNTFDKYKSKITNTLQIDYKQTTLNDFFNDDCKNNCNTEFLKSTKNHLIDSYKIKSFKINDLFEYFKILQVLNSKQLSTREVCEKIELSGFEIKKNRVNKVLTHLTKQGILNLEKKSNVNYYSLQPNIFKDLSTLEISKLYNALEFFSNTAFITVPGYYLIDTLNNYLKYEQNNSIKSTPKNIFVFEHFNMSKIIDDEASKKIVDYINLKKPLKFTFEESLAFNLEPPKEIDLSVYPLKLVTDFKYNRQYLIGYNLDDSIPEKERIKPYRLDRIAKIKNSPKPKSKIPDLEYEILKKDWTVSFVNNQKIQEKNSKKVYTFNEDDLKTIEVDFYFDKNHPLEIKDLIQKEKKFGEFKKIKNNHFLFSIKLYDPKAIKPWLRSFWDIAKVRKSNEHTLFEDLNSDIKEVLMKYGIND